MMLVGFRLGGALRDRKVGLNQPFHARFGVVCDAFGVSSGGRALGERKVGLNQPFHARFGVVCDALGVSSGGSAPRPKSWSKPTLSCAFWGGL